MKKIIIIIIGIVLIGAGIYFGRDFLPKLTSSQGELHVESQPETTVFVNDENKEKTPITQKIDPGQYEVKLVPDDQAAISTWQQSVTVNPGTQTFIKALLGDTSTTSSWEVIILEKLSGNETELSVSSATDASELYINGNFKGTSPLSFQDIAEGEHEIRLTAPGFAEKKIKVNVTQGYKLTVRTQLALVDESQMTQEQEGEKPAQAEDDGALGTLLITSPTTGWLRVRSEPTTSGEEVGRIDDGEKVTYFTDKDGWYEVEYEEGKKGWISGDYAEKVEETNSSQNSTNNNE
ncbi:MAG: Serine/threonine protein kinase [Candidatus Gottesmanbacteria bacterium GW2011_GWA2_42_18]|uniref:Serine/threonine protein kinase n=1 Tax=Candidatus Gottesmanbacteria bacterium GW2011_GWA2_42_18 TaxID=1618442 RepID=A0A0G0ZA93_9BACT|nr:MAG: Serine/threonine protein kinase [Candidatus Gottesmanbacteria bacterium GW2011_GWA2_42_18]